MAWVDCYLHVDLARQYEHKIRFKSGAQLGGQGNHLRLRRTREAGPILAGYPPTRT